MSTGSDARTDRISQDLSSALAQSGLVVEDLTVMAAGKRRVVRVLVDRSVEDLDADTPIAPLSLDEIADASRIVSDRLDETDAMGETPYVLEVSSPGTDRSLTQPRHFRRNVGRLVQLDLRDGTGLTGRIVRTTAESVTTHDAGTAHVTSYDEIAKARVQVEFNRPEGEDS